MSEDENEETPYLVTNYTFNKKDFLIKMYVRRTVLELSIVDSITSEKWMCSYNSLYIEELTRRTGNYKKFSIFVTMLHTGILRTNSCVRIELLSHGDLMALSGNRRQISPTAEEDTRKYLILVYTVEFDKIHYPIPLQYCGMPNPKVLQKRINYLEKEKRRLEEELAHSSCNKCSTQLPILQNKIIKLLQEKKCLEDEVKCLAAELCSKYSTGRIQSTNKPFTASNLSNEERFHLKEKIKILQEQNIGLNKTIENLNNKFHQVPMTSTKYTKTVSNQMQRCQKCISQNCLPTGLTSPRCSLKNASSRSSISSAGRQSSKIDNGRRKKIIKKTVREMSSSSGCESNMEMRNVQRKTRKPVAKRNSLLKQQSAPSMKPKLTSKRNQPEVRNFDKTDEMNTNLEQPHNNIMSPEELSQQINALVQVVESWSKNFYSCYHHM